MENKIAILLVEDDEDICRDFTETISRTEDFTLVACTNSSDEAITYTMQYLPDAVVLDLELHHGKGDGISYLKKLKALDLPKQIYILVTSNNESPLVTDMCRTLGASFFMPKHRQDYSTSAVLDHLRLLSHVLFHQSPLTTAPPSQKESEEQQHKKQEAFIRNELKAVGIKASNIGYMYLTDAILLEQEHTSMQEICGILARRYKKSSQSIERAMQNAISRAWETYDIDELLKYYTARIHPERGYPSLNEFVYYYAEKLEN